MYLGEDEILECFIGDSGITEAYLGEDLVFSSGPFSGLKLSPRQIEFKSATASTGTTAKLYVKSSEPWTLTTTADWFSLSPLTGVGTSNKEEVTITIISAPTADTTNVISCTTTSFSASSEVIFKTSYGIPANEIWYATYDGSRITRLNSWKVYNKNGRQMNNSSCNFNTYGKLIFTSDIGAVGGDMSSVNYGWSQLTELGLPEMDTSLCVGAKDFGFRYIQNDMPYWTRVYGDYPYIDDTETMAWGADGCGLLIARGKTGELVIPEGSIATNAYALCRSKFSSVVLPSTFVGGVSGYNNGDALGAYMFEDMTNLTSIKYKSMTAPSAGSSPFSRVYQSGTVYYPVGGTGDYPKPTNFTYQTY